MAHARSPGAFLVQLVFVGSHYGTSMRSKESSRFERLLLPRSHGLYRRRNPHDFSLFYLLVHAFSRFVLFSVAQRSVNHESMTVTE